MFGERMKSNRREFLRLGARLGAGSVLASATACVSGPSDSLTAQAPEFDVLAGDALDQAARIRSGQVSAIEMAEATIAKIEALNGPINAVVTRFYERALDEATSKQRKYKSAHTYSLEQFGLTEDEVYEELSDLFAAYGYDR